MVTMTSNWAIRALHATLLLLPSFGDALYIPHDGEVLGETDQVSPLSPRQQGKQALPTIVYRGDGMSPDEIKALKGISPHGRYALTNNSYDIFRHQRGASNGEFGSVYKGTTRDYNVALTHFAIRSSKPYVYKIRATPNMIDLEGSIRNSVYGSEQEFAAMGGILYDQIIGWVHTPLFKEDAGKILGLDSAAYIKAYGLDKITWNLSKDYDPKYDSLSASPGQPQLVDLEPGKLDGDYNPQNLTMEQRAIEFMNKNNGAAVGWDGKFPLPIFRTGDKATPSPPTKPGADNGAQPPVKENGNGGKENAQGGSTNTPKDSPKQPANGANEPGKPSGNDKKEDKPKTTPNKTPWTHVNGTATPQKDFPEDPQAGKPCV
ncbi:Heat-labile enterotoxin, A chain [Moelleriella libera RCEF 2490]|uniref:Heat-labile enterotoxin, A chain n=1 Tax=Moelleriella libera RCEF 2490 TaxID=1081109 RepID=A0A168F5X0_9HYPO|nr:Heat-labile enterotoxin, A chain [Moelleriella libera RCEF 2490]